MDRPKLLGICTVISVLLSLFMTTVSLLALQDLTENSQRQKEDLREMAEDFKACIKDMELSAEADGSMSTVTDTMGSVSEPQSASFYAKTVNGRIGIYTEDGYLVRLLELNVATLPDGERAALEKGIFKDSWEELLALLQDYGT